MATTQMYWVYESAIQEARQQIKEVEPRLIDVTGIKYVRALQYLSERYAIIAWCYRRQIHARPAFPPIPRKGKAKPAPVVLSAEALAELDAIPF